ncbi:hypothetical protein Clacol_009349 [Clathrus columnatus]|uniref:MFS transporter n=1 Tax=Clathrus columnatus TaxID=1419009 RepID=A0AAV5AKC6_9AGAM|nr:hypothetical protein Clacol_009349 [Clathrus columnatus]
MSQQQVMIGARHPLSATFLLHIALESPVAIQGLLAAQNLPFLDMNNTSLIIIRLFSALSAASCLGAFLVFPLPEYLPGKRAVAIILMLYHMIAAGIFWQAPRFIPYSLGALAEQAKLTPELLWAGLHGVVA